MKEEDAILAGAKAIFAMHKVMDQADADLKAVTGIFESQLRFQPTGNHILVRRLPAQKGVIDTSAHDEKAGGGMILVEGVILATGPGHYDDDGDFIPTTVKPGQRVIFNARWNDFSSGELVGSDCDKKGPLERPMPQWQWDKRDLHLITEGDIAGILASV